MDALARGEIEARVGPAREAARVGCGAGKQRTFIGAALILNRQNGKLQLCQEKDT